MGINIGHSIKHQLHIDQLDIGSALVWNARTNMIAIDSIVLDNGKHPKLYDDILLIYEYGICLDFT